MFAGVRIFFAAGGGGSAGSAEINVRISNADPQNAPIFFRAPGVVEKTGVRLVRGTKRWYKP